MEFCWFSRIHPSNGFGNLPSSYHSQRASTVGGFTSLLERVRVLTDWGLRGFQWNWYVTCYMSYMFYIFHRFNTEKDRKSTCTRTNRPNYSQLFPQLSWTPCPQSASAGAPHWAGIESGILDRTFQRAGENWIELCYIHYVKVYIYYLRSFI